jgi:hypothetical protein
VDEIELVEDIEEDDHLRMKAYNFIEGVIKRIAKEEKKRVMKMSAYFYIDQFSKLVLFDLQ